MKSMYYDVLRTSFTVLPVYTSKYPFFTTKPSWIKKQSVGRGGGACRTAHNSTAAGVNSEVALYGKTGNHYTTTGVHKILGTGGLAVYNSTQLNKQRTAASTVVARISHILVHRYVCITAGSWDGTSIAQVHLVWFTHRVIHIPFTFNIFPNKETRETVGTE